jgi:signal transduction histidine kinase
MRTLRRRSAGGLPRRGRSAAQVETAAYFIVAEALTNAARHASAGHATVLIEQLGGTARIEVSDNGSGGADASRGSGLRGLADRLTALDGRLAIEVRPAAAPD